MGMGISPPALLIILIFASRPGLRRASLSPFCLRSSLSSGNYRLEVKEQSTIQMSHSENENHDGKSLQQPMTEISELG